MARSRAENLARDVLMTNRNSRAFSTFPFQRYTDSTCDNMILTQAASRASMRARAMRRACAAEAQVVNTTRCDFDAMGSNNSIQRAESYSCAAQCGDSAL